FGKKFYNVIARNIGEQLYINIVAVAVSRSLTYLIYWVIPCGPEGPSSKIAYMPTEKEDKECLLPYLEKDNPIDVFESHGFIEVGAIFDNDGLKLSNWA
ncbi:MAG: hypothetical protein V3S09_04715, partial [Candidatus Bathyarchaeia archaeon]